MTAAAPVVVLRPEAIDRMHRLANTASNAELAAAIGAVPSELVLVATGRTSPSLALLSRIVVAFPQMTFSSLCSVA